MKTFLMASDITHLIFSTSFYLDELNPVTACDPDPTKFYWPHAFLSIPQRVTSYPSYTDIILTYVYLIVNLMQLMRFVIILIKLLCMYVCMYVCRAYVCMTFCAVCVRFFLAGAHFRHIYTSGRSSVDRFQIGSLWLSFRDLIHDILFLPISTIESRVRLRVNCKSLFHSRLACSRFTGHVQPSVNNPDTANNPLSTVE